MGSDGYTSFECIVVESFGENMTSRYLQVLSKVYFNWYYVWFLHCFAMKYNFHIKTPTNTIIRFLPKRIKIEKKKLNYFNCFITCPRQICLFFFYVSILAKYISHYTSYLWLLTLHVLILINI